MLLLTQGFLLGHLDPFLRLNEDCLSLTPIEEYQQFGKLEFAMEADVAFSYPFQFDSRCCGCDDPCTDFCVAGGIF